MVEGMKVAASWRPACVGDRKLEGGFSAFPIGRLHRPPGIRNRYRRMPARIVISLGAEMPKLAKGGSRSNLASDDDQGVNRIFAFPLHHRLAETTFRFCGLRKEALLERRYA